MARQTTEVYPEGTVLFRQGDESAHMFVVQDGEVEIVRESRSRQRLVAIVGPGEFFGELGLITGHGRNATAKVRRDARLLAIDADTLDAMVRGKTEIAIRMLSSLTMRLARADDQVELLLLHDDNHRVVLCLRQLIESVGIESEDGAAVHIPTTVAELALRVTLPLDVVTEILAGLDDAQLVVDAARVGLDEPGLVIPSVDLFCEFLDFLELKDRRLKAE